MRQRKASEMFTILNFIDESNRIEGIGGVSESDITAHEMLLAEPGPIEVEHLERFVRMVANAPLRDRPGMDVKVGGHFPPRGGTTIRWRLAQLLREVDKTTAQPSVIHRLYETLHPFMDGNGRSGRVLWLYMMGGIERAPLGFLHHWYYQSLRSIT